MIQSSKVRQHDLQSKITKIRTQLAAMREYKRLMAIDGIAPDAEDKVRESELIVKLLYLEKQLKGPKPFAQKPGAPNKFGRNSQHRKTSRSRA